VYVAELAVFVEESNDNDLTLAVPILVFEIVAVEVTLIDAFGTQCKSTVAKWLIGQVPI
jgi:hypothetical protein